MSDVRLSPLQVIRLRGQRDQLQAQIDELLSQINRDEGAWETLVSNLFCPTHGIRNTDTVRRDTSLTRKLVRWAILDAMLRVRYPEDKIRE